MEIASCASLLQSIGPNLSSDCPCHNFCGDTYLGCCSYASDCPLTCEPLLGEKFVAGCIVVASQPPVVPSSPPISQPPSPSPATNNTAEPTTSPLSQPLPSSECLVTSNEDRCEQLLRDSGPRDDECICRNFCNGEEIACCNLGQSCPPLECTGDFVAGCVDMNGEQTISPQPSPLPTPEPQCYVQVNTQQCDKFSFTQSPVPGCNCYNYCDGIFVGCATFDVFESIDCQGDLVAGCVLKTEPYCLVSVNTGECGPLMNSVFDDLQNSVNECSCYNFCGEQYVGCCGYNEFCGFKCPGPFSVTGCTLEISAARGAAKARDFDITIPANGDFYSPDVWPQGFYPYGVPDHDGETSGGTASGAPRGEEEIVL